VSKGSLSIFLLIFLLLNCGKNNNELNTKFENEFNDSIKKSNAKSFEYNYYELTPQKSYFVNSKLRFLKFHIGPEFGSIDSKIYYDQKTDSIKKHVLRIVEVENWKTEKLVDTIFVMYPEKKKIYSYVNNKLVDSTFKKQIFEWNQKFIKNIKHTTEEKYNYR
jgi:hypothetical protein